MRLWHVPGRTFGAFVSCAFVALATREDFRVVAFGLRPGRAFVPLACAREDFRCLWLACQGGLSALWLALFALGQGGVLALLGCASFGAFGAFVWCCAFARCCAGCAVRGARWFRRGGVGAIPTRRQVKSFPAR